MLAPASGTGKGLTRALATDRRVLAFAAV